jgi:hypothetical protein
LRRRTPPDDHIVEDAPPIPSAAQLANEGARPALADTADPIPVLPQPARKADAVISVSCGLAFAVLTVWISREGHAGAGYRPTYSCLGPRSSGLVERRPCPGRAVGRNE